MKLKTALVSLILGTSASVAWSNVPKQNECQPELSTSADARSSNPYEDGIHKIQHAYEKFAAENPNLSVRDRNRAFRKEYFGKRNPDVD